MDVPWLVSMDLWWQSRCLWPWSQNDSSWVTWCRHSAQSQEKNQHNTSLHGLPSYFDGAIWGISILFQVWPQRVEFTVEPGWLPLEKLWSFMAQPDLSSSVLHLSLLCLLEAFSSQLHFCLTVLFILLNYEFFEGKTSQVYKTIARSWTLIL